MEKLLKEKRKGPIKTIIIWAIIMLVILVVGIVKLNQPKVAKEEFNKDRSSEDIVSIDIYYLVGPIAEYTDGSRVNKECYVGIGEEELYVVITDEKNTTGVPVYTEDMTDEQIENLNPVTIVGKTKK